MHRLLRRLVLLPSIAIALVAPAIAPAAALAANEFPDGWKGYHSYPEMVDDIQAVAAAHPSIVRVFSIGDSYQGRKLWAAKISDNVGTDESEPEVLFDGLHHADEHMSLEMTLHILHWLADDYGSKARITRHREQPRGLDRVRVEPGRRAVRHPGWPLPLLAQEPPADPGFVGHRHRPQPQLRLPMGSRRADQQQPRRRSPTTARMPSPPPRPGRCATSCPRGSWADASRSGPRSRSTSPAGWSCGRTATRTRTPRRT